MNEFDELQSLRNEVARLRWEYDNDVAKLRQENGDLGEKLGAAWNDIAILRNCLGRTYDCTEYPSVRSDIDAALKRTDPLTRGASCSSMSEPSLYKGQDAGSSPAKTTNPSAPTL